MREQLPLLPIEEKARTIGKQPETSRIAYESVDMPEERRIVLTMIRRSGDYGMTADEVAQHRAYGDGHQRIAELRKAGLIAKNGQRRRTRAGRPADVYVAVK